MTGRNVPARSRAAVHSSQPFLLQPQAQSHLFLVSGIGQGLIFILEDQPILSWLTLFTVLRGVCG